MKMNYHISACAVLAGLLICTSVLPAADVGELSPVANDEATRIRALDQFAAEGPLAFAATGPIAALLKDPSAQIRAHAAHALGQIGEPAKPYVSNLAELVKDADSTVRAQAVKAILAIRPGPQVTIPLCVKMLEGADPAIQHRILHTISEAGAKAVPGLIEALKNDKACHWACVVLRDMGPVAKGAIPGLVAKLQDPRPEIRREVVLALAAMDQEATSAVPQIAPLLQDKHVALAATYALARIGAVTDQVQQSVQKNTQSEDKVLSTVSLWALAKTRPQDKALRTGVTEKLIGRLGDSDQYVRLAAARGLASLPPAPEITLPIWQKMLKDADETTMAHSLDALAQLGSQAAPSLAQALKYESLRPQVIHILNLMGPDAAPAAQALGDLVAENDNLLGHSAALAIAAIGPGAKDAVPALVQALQHEDNPNTHAIAYALGEIGSAAMPAQAVLLQLAGGSNEEIAIISAWSANKINLSPATAAKTLPVLTSALGSESPVFRRGAAESLGQMGKLANKAVPALENAQRDSDSSVRESATRALARIRS